MPTEPACSPRAETGSAPGVDAVSNGARCANGCGSASQGASRADGSSSPLLAFNGIGARSACSYPS